MSTIAQKLQQVKDIKNDIKTILNENQLSDNVSNTFGTIDNELEQILS